MKRKIRHPQVKPQANPELAALADLVGEFIEYWGFKAVQGRMWCYLYLLARPLSSKELAQLVRISPALVTQSIQVLSEYQLIVQASKGPNGVLRFEANPDVAAGIRRVLASREMRLFGRIATAAETLKGKRSSAPASVQADETRVALVTEWVSVAQLGLGMGMDLLKGADHPFARPAAFATGLSKRA